MIKEIKYSGYSASPSDYESPDGELAAAVNLIPENGALHPVLPSKELYTLPNDCKVTYLHIGTEYSHCIVVRKLEDTIPPYEVLYFDFTNNPDNPPVVITDDDARLHSITYVSAVYKITSIGNVLVVLTPRGIEYFLWKNGTYTGLSLINLPRPEINFSLKETFFVNSDYIRITNVTSNQSTKASIDGIEVCTSARMNSYLRTPYDNSTASPDFYTSSSEDNAQRVFTESIMAKANKLFADEVSGKGMFCFPFFVRYALRLYDGSLIMHSAPILMLPSQFHAYVSATEDDPNVSNNEYQFRVGGYPCKLECQVLFQLDSKWRDIISSIDIFISAPIYDYDYAGTCKKLLGGCYTRKSICDHFNDSSGGYLVDGGSDPSIIGSRGEFYNKHLATLPQLPKEQFLEKIKDIQNYYLLKSIPFEEFSTSSRRSLNISNDYLEALTSRELMTDDYQTNDTLIPNYAYSFNNRLNISGIKRKLFSGFNLFEAVCLNTGAGSRQVDIFVEIETDDGTIIVKNYGYSTVATVGLTWFFYPDPKATRAILKIGSAYYELPLTPHSFLNGAYYYNNLDGPSTISLSGDPQVTADPTISLLNKIYTSEINNPFFFPLLGINTVGTGEIMGICAATKALSQGQFGQFPLYAFSSEGVWAMETSSSGAYIARHPVTRDVCINRESITQTDDSVLFATDRGIIMLTGSNAICITDVLDGKGADVFGELPSGHVAAIKNKAEALGLVSGSLNFVPFKTYVASAKLIYDYTHQRIILFNPNTSYNYAYVFSLESKAWGMMATNLVDSLNSYPNALAVDSDRHLLDMCQEVTEVEVSTPSAAPSTTPTTQSNPGASTSIGDPVATEPSSGIAEPGEEYGGSGSSGTQSENTGESSSETSGGESTTTDETEEAEEATTTTVPVTVPAVLITRPLKLELPEILKTVDRVIQRGRLNIHASGHVPVQSILYGSRDLYHWHMVKSSTDHQLRGFRGTPYKYFKIVLLCNLLPDESLYGASVSLEARYTNRPR